MTGERRGLLSVVQLDIIPKLPSRRPPRDYVIHPNPFFTEVGILGAKTHMQADMLSWDPSKPGGGTTAMHSYASCENLSGNEHPIEVQWQQGLSVQGLFKWSRVWHAPSTYHG